MHYSVPLHYPGHNRNLPSADLRLVNEGDTPGNGLHLYSRDVSAGTTFHPAVKSALEDQYLRG